MAKPTLLGGNLMIAPKDWETVKNLAKEGVKSRGIIAGLRVTIKALRQKVADLIAKVGKKRSVTAELRYRKAAERAPQRLADAINEIMRQPPKRTASKPAPMRTGETTRG